MTSQPETTPNAGEQSSEETFEKKSSKNKIWLALGGIFLLAILIVVGVYLYASSQDSRDSEEILASCSATAFRVNGVIDMIDEDIIRQGESFNISDPANTPMWATVWRAYTITDCDPDDLYELIEMEGRTDATKTLYTQTLADVMLLREDFDNIPEEVAVLLALFPQNGETPQMVPDTMTDQDLILVFADEDCECFENFDNQLDASYPELPVYIVDTAAGYEAIATKYGWLTIGGSQIPVVNYVDNLPKAVLIRNGVTYQWFSSLEDPELDLSSIETALKDPKDFSAEPVRATLVVRETTCDANRGAGVIINTTARPINAIVALIPNTEFKEDGFAIVEPTVYDLGKIDPWGYITFDEFAGDAENRGPCGTVINAYYVDGLDSRSGDAVPVTGAPPADFIDDPFLIIEIEKIDMPEQIMPAAGYPTANDVTPIDD